MSQMELCLIGKRGKIPQPRGSRNVRQLVTSLRGRHSEKPDEVRKRIEEMFPHQNKIELFARQAPRGWDIWGDEVTPTLVVDWK
jgi:N6-adenosine-specific RNA methylase IME4